MNEIPSRRLDRDAVLVALYSLTSGSSHPTVSYENLVAATGLDLGRVEAAVEYLTGRKLAQYVTMGPTIGITPKGVDRAEELLAPPPTEPSQLLAPLTVAERREVESLLHRAFEALDEATDLDAETKAAVRADLDTVNVQLRSPRPSRLIIRTIFHHAVALAENVLGGVLGGVLLAQLFGS